MENIKVSLLIPVYRVAQYVERCARSLFEQTFLGLEFIFVNDCSPDNSMEIIKRTLEEYPMRLGQVRMINNEKNLGIAQVRNILLREARGDYVLFVDSDDWLEKETVEILYKKAVGTSADIVGMGYYNEMVDRSFLVPVSYPLNAIDCLRKTIQQELEAYLVLKLVKRSLFTDYHLQTDFGINIGEDYILSVKLFCHASLVSDVNGAYYHYTRFNVASYTNTNSENYEVFIQMINAAEEYCKKFQIYEQLKVSFDMRKFLLKQKMYHRNRDFHIWKQIYPEANYAWRCYNMNIQSKILYWLLEHNMGRWVSLIS